MFLSNDFLDTYPDFPEHMTDLGMFTFLRTYSRIVEDDNGQERKETWKETVTRTVDYSLSLESRHHSRNDFSVGSYFFPEMKAEAERLFHNVFNLRQFPSGRSLWVGGAETGVAEKYPTANYNCSFVNIDSLDALGELFYLLMVGTGVGFRCTQEAAASLPHLKNDFVLTVLKDPVDPEDRIESTVVSSHQDGESTWVNIEVGDSKEGWSESLVAYLNALATCTTDGLEVFIDVTSVRPKGEALKTFGGSASGPEPLIEMFESIRKVIRGEIDPFIRPPGLDKMGHSKLRPIHILDIGNLIGNNVVVGGVRRTAEIFICDQDDYESMWAKFGINGIWNEQFEHLDAIEAAAIAAGVPLPMNWDNMRTPFLDDDGTLVSSARIDSNYRRMSNNSIGFTSKPSPEMMDFLFLMMQFEGEPGFINLREAARRRVDSRWGFSDGMTPIYYEELIEEELKKVGLNPCAEILLQSRGVCNLTTVNVAAFVDANGGLNMDGLLKAQRLSVRMGLRMTLEPLELPQWDTVQQMDRLLGPSLTGFQDAMAATGKTKAEEVKILAALRQVAHEEVEAYSKQLGVNLPLLVTTVKPEGTLSQVAGGVSSGVHMSHAPFYIRRIRVTATDPVAQAAIDAGVPFEPEVGTPGDTREEQISLAHTLVFEFPVASEGSGEQDIDSQLDTYFMFQEHYCDHNASNTISVKPGEWDRASERILEQWDEFCAVSFLDDQGGTYQLAPYEEITEDRYNQMVADSTTAGRWSKLYSANESDLASDESCATGVCPIR